MCIAVLVKPGAARPGLDDLKKMERANDDGAGVGWYDHEIRRCRWVKGLKAEEVAQVMARVPQTSVMLIHFRMASVGGDGPGLTHPFPIGMPPTNEKGEYVWNWDMALEGVADELLIHNGHDPSILNRMPKNGMPDGPWSDTRFVAYMADQNPEFIKDLSGKVALINSAGRGMVLGPGWTEKNGVFLSNTYWEYSPVYSGTTTGDHRFGYYDTKLKKWVGPTDKEYSQEAEEYWDAWAEMDRGSCSVPRHGTQAQTPLASSRSPEATGGTKALTATTGFGAVGRAAASQAAAHFAAERTKRERKAEEARKRQQAHKERQEASRARKEKFVADNKTQPRDLVALLRCSDYTAGFTTSVGLQDSSKKGVPRVTCRDLKDGHDGPWRIRFEDGLGGFIEVTEEERALQMFWMGQRIQSWVDAMNALFADESTPLNTDAPPALEATEEPTHACGYEPPKPPEQEPVKTATEEFAEVQQALQAQGEGN